MPTAIDLAWLIPIIPFSGACIIGILFVSFNRTMSRLSKPVAFILISCAISSLIISCLLFVQESSQEITKIETFDWNSGIANINLHFGLIVDKTSSIFLLISSFIIILSMFLYHLKMYRKKGYVLFFIYIALIGSSLLAFPISSFARNYIAGIA